MATFAMQLTGDREVLRMFGELPERARKRVMEPLLAEASRAVAAIARADAPKETGLLERALGPSKLSRYGGGTKLFIAVGARRGFRRAVSRTRGGKGKVLSAARTDRGEGAMVRDPIKYLHLVTGGRKVSTAGARLGAYAGASGGFRSITGRFMSGEELGWRRAAGSRVLYSSYLGKFLGKSARAVSPNPFMDRAFRQSQAAVMTLFESRAPGLIEAEAAKLGNK